MSVPTIFNDVLLLLAGCVQIVASLPLKSSKHSRYMENSLHSGFKPLESQSGSSIHYKVRDVFIFPFSMASSISLSAHTEPQELEFNQTISLNIN